MQQKRLIFLGFAAVLAATMAARAGEGQEARTLIDKAIQAQGGEANLAKYPALTAKMKGTFHGLGDPVPYTGEYAAQWPDRQAIVMEFEAGEKIRMAFVFDRNKAWMKFNDDKLDLDEAQFADAKEEAYSEWVAGLLPLKDKAFTLTTLPEVIVEKRPALGVKVAQKGHGDVLLYFDKETALLVKYQCKVKDQQGGQVKTKETFFSNYKELQGTKVALKLAIFHDSQPFVTCELIDCRLSEKVDERLFAK